MKNESLVRRFLNHKKIKIDKIANSTSKNKKFLLDIFLVLPVTVTLTACGSDANNNQIRVVETIQTQGNNIKKSSANIDPKLSMKAEESWAIIDSFFEKNSKTYVSVDFVDYIETTDTEKGGISNVNPKLRTYHVTKSEYRTCSDAPKSIEALRTEWEATQIDRPIYNIKAINGKVITLYLAICAG